MKSSTQITLIVIGAVILALVACLPITLLTFPLIQRNQEPTPDTFATIQAIVTQTIAAEADCLPVVQSANVAEIEERLECPLLETGSVQADRPFGERLMAHVVS